MNAPDELAEHLRRTEALGQLTAGLAHDFNNLLTVIQGNLDALGDLQGVRDDPASRPLVDAAMRATQRGAELIRALMTVARRQALASVAVDVQALLQELFICCGGLSIRASASSWPRWTALPGAPPTPRCSSRCC